ncbi:DUF3299 domain-containing protein [Phaeobacter marinintestinus]|uniref:DUF3299 domain-containing protein n=1 Tax=Falsiphaeobacter marinintestinus TaxID=1492905 RepID=UPI0011B3AC7F|nr:DUF3299 domain-containing protein [Phaeobacter marinintestinus]
MTVNLSRRGLLQIGAAGVLLPGAALSAQSREITWDDLIPPGTPYGEIIGAGEIDQENDTWLPEYDENAAKLNMELDGLVVRMPGYIVPLELEGSSTTVFLLVPYVGACVHVPPPPPNQLVLVTSEIAWPSDSMWDAVWVTGKLLAKSSTTEIAEAGYHMTADSIERYE